MENSSLIAFIGGYLIILLTMSFMFCGAAKRKIIYSSLLVHIYKTNLNWRVEEMYKAPLNHFNVLSYYTDKMKGRNNSLPF